MDEDVSRSFDSNDPSPTNSNDLPAGDIDASAVDLEANLASMMVRVEPVLNELFKAAAENDDYWLRKRTVRVFVDWIVSILNVSQLMEQQVRALGATLQAQEKELEELRPKKSKMWVPGVG